MTILSWDKPKQVLTKEEWSNIVADGVPPGVYTPNMSSEDVRRWNTKEERMSSRDWREYHMRGATENRLIDASIAESIFGIQVHWWQGEPRVPVNDGVHVMSKPIRAYSSDFNDCMLVVQEMRLRWRTDDPEETYWEFSDCQEYGWRVDIMHSHHDGDMALHTASDESLAVAICKAALMYEGCL